MPFLKPASPRGSPDGAPSVTHTLPSRSRKKPCGKLIAPFPKLFTSLPSASTWMIGSRSDSAQPFAPHRSRIHMCFPSGSILMPLATPILRPCSLSQLKFVRYGFDGTCAVRIDPDRNKAAAPAAQVETTRLGCVIRCLQQPRSPIQCRRPCADDYHKILVAAA